ncbi:MAG: hypothetical protein HYU52_09390 [Acidobacteria bacterium]|nr:hypothetical protein [Acidobacteriota bacterium]
MRAVALARCFGGAVDFQRGRWSSAEQKLRESVQLYRSIGGAFGEAIALQRLGVLLTARGDVAGALGVIDEGVVAGDRAVLRSHCLTRLFAARARNRLAAGDHRGAAESIRAGEETGSRHARCVTCNALLLPEIVRVALGQGDGKRARVAADELGRVAAQYGSRAWRAMAWQSEARVEARSATGTERALDRFESAAALYEEIDYPYEVARCRLAQSELLRARGDDVRAATLHQVASGILAALGAAGIEH